VRITRIVTSVIEIVEEEPAPMSIRQAWPAPVSLPVRGTASGNGLPPLGSGLLANRPSSSSSVAVGAAVVGAASAAAALLSNDHVRRRVAVGAMRVRTALEGVRDQASRRATALRSAPRIPRALPASVVEQPGSTGPGDFRPTA